MIKAKEAWVDTVSDIANIVECDASYSFLQLVSQIHYTKGSLKSYKKCVVRINTANDFQYVNPLQISVADSNEELMLHSVVVRRSGEIIDKTHEMTFSELQREPGLENSVITGTKTFIGHINNLQIGDVVTYEYTTINVNPLYENHFEYMLPMSYGVPIYHLAIKVFYGNNERHCSYRIYDGTNEVERTYINSEGVFSWEKHEIPPVLLEDQIPFDRNPYSYVEFSDSADWTDLGNILKQHYSFKETYRTNSLQDYLNDIINNCTEESSIIEALVAHVQKNIAYMSISMSEHSYIPHDPQFVIKNNYGDCKDKVLLLKTLLKIKNIESTPVVVHSYSSKSTLSHLPLLQCFNHVVLSIAYNGMDILVDPTNTNDCFTIANYAEPWFSTGLYLEDTPQLKTLSDKKNSRYVRKITEHIKIKGDTASMSIKDEYMYHAFPQVAQRHSTISRDVCKKTYLDFYSKRYPTIQYNPRYVEGKEFATSLEFANHNFIINAELLVPSLWSKDGSNNSTAGKAEFYPLDLLEIIYRLPGTQRRHPFAWPHPTEFLFTFIIEYDFEATMGNLDETIENQLFKYSVKTTERNFVYRYEVSYQSLSDTIEPEDFSEQQKMVNKFIDNLGFTITKPLSKASYSDTNNSGQKESENNKDGYSVWLKIFLGILFLSILKIIAQIIK